MRHDARLGEPAGVEANFRRGQVGKGDPGTFRTDVLVIVVRGPDVALLVSQARAGQDTVRAHFTSMRVVGSTPAQ